MEESGWFCCCLSDKVEGGLRVSTGVTIGPWREMIAVAEWRLKARGRRLDDEENLEA